MKPSIEPEGDDSNGQVSESEIWFSCSDTTCGKNGTVGFTVLTEIPREEVIVRESLSSLRITICDCSSSS